MIDVSRGKYSADELLAPFVAEAIARLCEQGWDELDPGRRILDQDAIRRAASDTLRADLARIARPAPAGHPLSAQRITRVCEQTVAVTAQTVARFAADRAKIVDALFDHVDPGRLIAIEPTSGDPHQGGRRVAFLRFEGGVRPLVYKPRPLGSATLYQDLTDWLNARLPGLAMAAMPTLVEDGYGWAGYVAHEPCRTSAEVERFYYRQGALLALLYAVNATDAHAENLVACGDQPILIDTETLLHPVLSQRTLVGADPALAALEHSVFRAALLPTLVHGERGAMDISGIGGHGGPVGNRAALPDRTVEPGEHVPELLRGFGDVYTTIGRDADAFIECLVSGEDVVTRFVPRPTRVYADLIEDCLAPETLRDPDRMRALFESVLTTEEFEELGALQRYERLDLERLDIPIFFARRDSRSVWSSGGERIADMLAVSGIDAARAKVRAMDDADRHRQEWFVAAAFATVAGPMDHRCAAPLQPARSRPRPPLDPQWALDQAYRVARRLDRLAYRDEARGRVNWLSLEPLEDGHLTVLPAGAGLPHGYVGVALFLAQLGAVGGRTEYLDRAHEVIRPLPWLLAALAQRPAHLAAIGGGFAGLGGIAYSLTRLAKLLDSAEIGACATETVELAARATAAAGPESGLEYGLQPADDPGDGWCGYAGRAATGGIRPTEFEAWLTRLADLPPVSDLSLCHGELGILEALTILAARQDEAARAVLERRRSLLPEAIRLGARFNGTPGDVPTPGLMHGLAGVGYGLLRMGFAQTVPSVLTMER